MNSLEAAWHRLGITADHLAACRLPAYPEATQLVDAGCDLFGRPQQMTRTTLAAWRAMRSNQDQRERAPAAAGQL